MYHRMAAKHVTGPLLRQAEAAQDPVERSQRLMLAQLNALFLDKMATVRERVLLDRRQGAPSGAEPGKTRSVSELLAISQQLITLVKAIPRCGPYPSLPKTRNFTINSPRLASLASAETN